ncbi:MAG TPA: zinc-ribbon domain-containing protein [Gemmatimonadales bacterium]|nr:zinc-ribbon domain-containing protein [Gemmatimonadales bacterium]
MNVTCPNCATVYRVDPAKVPEAGVRARCSICSAVFAVQGETQERPAAASAAAPPSPQPAAPPPAPARAASAPMAPPARPGTPPRPAAAPPTPAVPAPPMPRPAAAVPPAPPARPPAAPAAAPPPPQPAAARPAATGTRPVNPFLSQDPALKARRLARALISDMVVYHPAKRQEGLRDGNLKELFDEEIKKSWEEYADQVGKNVADTTPYFKEALNEILAGGRQIF